MPCTPAIEARLAAYTRNLQEDDAIHTDAVAQAFASVPRHLFIPAAYINGTRIIVGDNPDESLLDLIYSNTCVTTHTPDDEAGVFSAASQPALVADMLEALDVRPGMRVLEIGAGTGYNAALLAALDARVFTVESNAVVAREAAQALQAADVDRVTVLHGDGYHGYPDAAPYDRIVVTCGTTGLPPGWLRQLAPDGFALVPVAHGGRHPIIAVAPPTSGLHPSSMITGRAVLHADFVTAAGALYQQPEPYVRAPLHPFPEAGVTTVPDIGPALEPSRYSDLWFHIGACDPRTTHISTEGVTRARGFCGLHTESGTAWIERDGTGRYTGNFTLLEQLTSLIKNWERHGRPAITDWTSALPLTGTENQALHSPTDWRLTSNMRR